MIPSNTGLIPARVRTAAATRPRTSCALRPSERDQPDVGARIGHPGRRDARHPQPLARVLQASFVEAVRQPDNTHERPGQRDAERLAGVAREERVSPAALQQGRQDGGLDPSVALAQQALLLPVALGGRGAEQVDDPPDLRGGVEQLVVDGPLLARAVATKWSQSARPAQR